jgi:hypothetical protein
MRITGQNPAQDIDSIDSKIYSRFLLTSAGHPQYAVGDPMEPDNIPKRPKDGRKAAYPLRFKNKTQKERLERAARKSGKSLRDFILHHAELAAAGTGESQTT